MKKYSLILSQQVSATTKIKVFELCKDGKSLLEEFNLKIETDGNLTNNFSGAIRIIEDTSNLQLRPKSQFRQLVDKNVACKIYEAKSGSIRLYLFHEEKKGRIIVGGGVKGTQTKDIKKLKNTIIEYLNQNKI